MIEPFSPKPNVPKPSFSDLIQPAKTAERPNDRPVPAGDTPADFLIIGPSLCGKTSLLGVLDTAANLESENSDWKFEIFPEGEPMEKLLEAANKIFVTGRLEIPSTNELTTYEFILKSTPLNAKRSVYGKPPLVAQEHRFQMMDGRGEWLFGDVNSGSSDGDKTQFEENRNKLIELGKKSRGLILCMDASNPAAGKEFLVNMQSVFKKMSTNNVLPFERVALVLNKADKVFANDGRNALEKAKDSKPWDKVYADSAKRTGISPLVLAHRAKTAGRNAHGFCWHGFYRQTIIALNYDPVKDTLLGFEANQDCWRQWKPFRVLDPFVYVATNMSMSMEKGSGGSGFEADGRAQ